MVEGNISDKLDLRVLEKLKAILKEKKMKPVHLARGLNYSDSWSHYLMSGERGLTVNQLIKIAELLDINPSVLLPEGGNQQNFDPTDYIRFIIREEIRKELKKE
jgi:transcriptional regulator with XRE-family HTH domain